MAISAQSAARYLGELSGWTLSNLKMQKILYMAHMYHLGVHGESMIDGQFEAWDYGPVHPDLYFDARIFGSSPVKNIFHGSADIKETRAAESIKTAFTNLKKYSAGQLVDITHRANGAWYKNYTSGMRRVPIPNSDVMAEYMLRTEQVGE